MARPSAAAPPGDATGESAAATGPDGAQDGTDATTSSSSNESPSAPSEDVERARELALNGRALFRDGNYDAAIAAFEAAFGLVRDPNLLYNISIAQERAGRYTEAADALDRYRVYAAADERESLQAKAAELRAKAATKARPEPEAQAADASSEAVDGPQPEVTGGPSEAAPTRPPLFGPGAWALAGGAAVGLGMGIGFGVSAAGHTDRAESLCRGELCPVNAEASLGRAKGQALIADISFAAGGLAAVGLAVVLGVKAKRRRLEVTPVGGASTAGLVVRGRF